MNTFLILDMSRNMLQYASKRFLVGVLPASVFDIVSFFSYVIPALVVGKCSAERFQGICMN